MPEYFVRKSGNDGNDGLNPDTEAWLTIDHAADNVAAGDTVWIGSGIYRELVTMDTSGTSGNQISFIGDIDGVETGDPGPVIISAFNSETTAAARNWCINTSDEEFLVFQYLILDGGLSGAIGQDVVAIPWAMEGVEILDCALLAGEAATDFSFYTLLDDGVTPATNGLQIKRCALAGAVMVAHTNNESAHLNVKMTIENNLVLGRDTYLASIFFDSLGGAGAFTIGGIDVRNNTFLAGQFGVYGDGIQNVNDPLNCHNNYFWGTGTALINSGGLQAAHVEDWNHFCNTNAATSGLWTSGGNSDFSVAGPALGGIADLMFYNKLGWSPWKPWEPMSLLDGTYEQPLIDAASASFAPADDVYGNPRPMRRNADDIGMAEARTRPEEDTVAADTVSAIKGAGYLDMMAAVAAEETTFEVVGRYDGNYTGSLPIFRVLEIPGVADQSDVMIAAANTDETLSITFTPTSAGYVRLRLESRDTSANGEAYFKDLA